MVKGKEAARRLVKTLLRRVPKEKDRLMSTGDLLGFMANLYRKERVFRNFLLSPFVPSEVKEKVLRTLVERFGAPNEVLEVFSYMTETHSFSLLPEMKKVYDHEVERIMRMSKGHLYLAEGVDDSLVDRIKETIQKVLGRELEIEVSQDPSLIGGFLFKTSGFVVDTSVRRHLERLLIGG